MSVFDAEYEPSPWGPIAEEVERYERSGGTEPSELVGDSWIILWTVGAKSGKVRKTPLVRVADGRAGTPSSGRWVEPRRTRSGCTTCERIRSHVCRTVRMSSTTVREVEGEEKTSWWKRANAVWPDYDNYQAATERQIRSSSWSPAALTSDWAAASSQVDLDTKSRRVGAGTPRPVGRAHTTKGPNSRQS